jgi:electron transfer flavoprotein alpha subunit
MKSFIYIEPSAEGIDSMTRQIASRIRKVAPEIRGSVNGISLGNWPDSSDPQVCRLFDELTLVEVPSGSAANTEVLAKILADVVRENGPGVLFLGFTHQGMELGPAVGWALGIPVITNCVGLDWTGSQAHLRRPIDGGRLWISLEVNLERGGVVSVQKGVWKDEEAVASREDPVSVQRLSWRESWAAEKTEVVGVIEEGLDGGEDITKAEILVSVGRGLGDPERLPIVKELAEKLGAMISCSRPVVDLGWLPASRQVGISGRTVAPVIYLALGISGQANHVAGMDASRTILAVNKDPAAPIFNVAHFGVVDDLMEFIPQLLEQIGQKQISGTEGP